MPHLCPKPCGRLATAGVFVSIGIIQLVAGIFLLRSNYVFLLSGPDFWTSASNVAVGSMLSLAASVWKTKKKKKRFPKYIARNNLVAALLTSAIILNSTTAVILILGEGNTLLAIQMEGSGKFDQSTFGSDVLAFAYATSVCAPIVCIVVAISSLSGNCFQCYQKSKKKKSKITQDVLEGKDPEFYNWVFTPERNKQRKSVSIRGISSSSSSSSSSESDDESLHDKARAGKFRPMSSPYLKQPCLTVNDLQHSLDKMSRSRRPISQESSSSYRNFRLLTTDDFAISPNPRDLEASYGKTPSNVTRNKRNFSSGASTESDVRSNGSEVFSEIRSAKSSGRKSKRYRIEPGGSSEADIESYNRESIPKTDYSVRGTSYEYKDSIEVPKRAFHENDCIDSVGVHCSENITGDRMYKNQSPVVGHEANLHQSTSNERYKIRSLILKNSPVIGNSDLYYNQTAAVEDECRRKQPPDITLLNQSSLNGNVQQGSSNGNIKIVTAIIENDFNRSRRLQPTGDSRMNDAQLQKSNVFPDEQINNQSAVTIRQSHSSSDSDNGMGNSFLDNSCDVSLIGEVVPINISSNSTSSKLPSRLVPVPIPVVPGGTLSRQDSGYHISPDGENMLKDSRPTMVLDKFKNGREALPMFSSFRDEKSERRQLQFLRECPKMGSIKPKHKGPSKRVHSMASISEAPASLEEGSPDDHAVSPAATSGYVSSPEESGPFFASGPRTGDGGVGTGNATPARSGQTYWKGHKKLRSPRSSSKKFDFSDQIVDADSLIGLSNEELEDRQRHNRSFRMALESRLKEKA